MAKATNPRKPARDKRKGGAAAKRTASKRATPARKFTTSAAHPRGSARVIGRPSGGRTLPGARRSQEPSTVSVGAPTPPAPEPPRTPPPLPVPIASFTF
jgi:hypothetical protein